MKIEEIKQKVGLWFKELDRKKILRILGYTFLGGVAFLLILFLSVWIGVFGKLPSNEELTEIKQPVASIVFSEDSTILGKYFIENRNNLRWDEVPQGLVNALVATEDARFYTHNGIDHRSLLRVLFRTILLRDRSGGGGSTITQQLAKNLMGREGRMNTFKMVVTKIKENIVAKKLEKIYTKEEILTLYLNTVNFGGTVYGLKTASRTYFNSDPEDLNIQQSATLVGMLKATTSYNPLINQDKAQVRRNTVLRQMQKYDYLDEAFVDSLSLLPIELDYTSDDRGAGLATYLREAIRIEVPKLLENHQHPEGRPYNLYKDGLHIYTTIDPVIQAYAELAVEEHMSKLQNTFEDHWSQNEPWQDSSLIAKALLSSTRYQTLVKDGYNKSYIDSTLRIKRPTRVFSYEGDKVYNFSTYDSISYYLSLLEPAFLVADHSTGAVKGYVGGIDNKYIQLDHVKVKRQVGSVFKPFVFLAALEQEMDPCEYYPNELISYPEYEGWTPQNVNREYGGYYSFQGILEESLNTPTVQVALKTGMPYVTSVAKRLGVTSELTGAPSMSLGAADLSLWEIVQSYMTIAARGKFNGLHYITKIEDANGIVLYTKPEQEDKWVIKSDYTQMITSMLMAVVDSGTAGALKSNYGLYSMNIAGKTGTSQNNSDGWFVGYTPDLVAAAWVGGLFPEIRFRSTSIGSGSRTAMPIWGTFFNKIAKDEKYRSSIYRQFPPLSEELQQKMACEPYLDEIKYNWLQEIFNSGNDENINLDTTINKLSEKIKTTFKRIFKSKKNSEVDSLEVIEE